MGKTYKDSRNHSEATSRKYRHMSNFVSTRVSTGKCVTGKVGFPNELAAQQRAGEILASGNCRGATSFRVYFCQLCNHYHLTSKPIF